VSAGAPAAAPLSSLEIAYGFPLGLEPGVAALPRTPGVSPRAALEGVLLDALRRPPCVVSFSGGQDSSALLALAVTVARREGLPDPVPVTLVFPGAKATDESVWQRVILDRFALTEHVRLEFTDELDALGPYAQRVLGTHGLVWPFNLHFHLPIVEVARGGSLVTGFGGDELARSSVSVHAERMLRQRRIGGVRDAAHLGYRLSPRPVQRVREHFRAAAVARQVPWLTPRGTSQLTRALRRDYVFPLGWGRVLRQVVWRMRYFTVCRRDFDVMAAPYDVRVSHPFVEAPVLQALAEAGSFAGLGHRRQILEALLGDLLPQTTLERVTKATYTDPLWTATAQRFAAAWDGRGVDAELVDPEALRRAWAVEPRPITSTTLLQAAWLAGHRAG